MKSRQNLIWSCFLFHDSFSHTNDSTDLFFLLFLFFEIRVDFSSEITAVQWTKFSKKKVTRFKWQQAFNKNQDRTCFGLVPSSVLVKTENAWFLYSQITVLKSDVKKKIKIPLQFFQRQMTAVSTKNQDRSFLIFFSSNHSSQMSSKKKVNPVFQTGRKNDSRLQ